MAAVAQPDNWQLMDEARRAVRAQLESRRAVRRRA
jgi:hypothetical protein